jgi:hypothetical protein
MHFSHLTFPHFPTIIIYREAIKMQNLLCVKSIITVALILALCVLCFIYPDQYSETLRNCVTMVVTFYFAHQQEKIQKGASKPWET